VPFALLLQRRTLLGSWIPFGEPVLVNVAAHALPPAVASAAAAMEGDPSSTSNNVVTTPLKLQWRAGGCTVEVKVGGVGCCKKREKITMQPSCRQ